MKGILRIHCIIRLNLFVLIAYIILGEFISPFSNIGVLCNETFYLFRARKISTFTYIDLDPFIDDE